MRKSNPMDLKPMLPQALENELQLIFKSITWFISLLLSHPKQNGLGLLEKSVSTYECVIYWATAWIVRSFHFFCVVHFWQIAPIFLVSLKSVKFFCDPLQNILFKEPFYWVKLTQIFLNVMCLCVCVERQLPKFLKQSHKTKRPHNRKTHSTKLSILTLFCIRSDTHNS